MDIVTIGNRTDEPRREETREGNYFVSNYPPFSFWRPERIGEAEAALAREPAPDTPLGIYVHIPFCRKRCHFCYFKVYTGKDSTEIETYLDAVRAELRLYADRPVIGGRKARFIYFGGGTPSYLSTKQLGGLVSVMKEVFPWDAVEEVTFECEPGTLTEGKLEMLREMGVTRLSLGIENFDDEILQLNGRAHVSKEIDRAYTFARQVGFPQINIDLIAGMVGETEENWRETVRRAVEMAPDSVTIYQMEVPFNTTISREMRVRGEEVAPVADWTVKRAWAEYGFSAFREAGYTVTSAYTAVKDAEKATFLYRNLLWAGADMLGLGVASFSHVGGTHYQNEHSFETYVERLQRGELPLLRALTPTADERLVREFILQLKLGATQWRYFQEKYGVDPRARFASELQGLRADGFASLDESGVRLSRDGVLQVDRLLHRFFLPEHQNARYA
ncbi:MAG TPA: coproporphyrinogen-III oxidase family protein [Bryobacteraceae bacterium]|nr:coproporphyrinogen-III oxidase family protein [Bryobacteraceae bacterium]